MATLREFVTWTALIGVLTCWLWVIYILIILCSFQNINDYQTSVTRWFYVILIYYLAWLTLCITDIHIEKYRKQRKQQEIMPYTPSLPVIREEANPI